MRVGGLEETITVTGESPVVDVQSARREIVMQDDVIQTIAGDAGRRRAAQRHARPHRRQQRRGAVADDDLLQRALEHDQFDLGGRRRAHDRSTALPLRRRAAAASRRTSTTRSTPKKSAITVGGGLGESDIGGPVMNIVPRSGGNIFAGSAFLNLAGEWSRGNNLTDELTALNPNLTQTPGIIHAYDCQRLVRRPDQAGSPLVLRQLPRPQHADGDGRHQRQRQRRRRRRAGTGSARRSPRASCRTAR